MLILKVPPSVAGGFFSQTFNGKVMNRPKQKYYNYRTANQIEIPKAIENKDWERLQRHHLAFHFGIVERD